jgi:hypothetical protein
MSFDDWPETLLSADKSSRTCVVCGKEFMRTPKRASAVTCPGKCQKGHRRMQHNEASKRYKAKRPHKPKPYHRKNFTEVWNEAIEAAVITVPPKLAASVRALKK